MLPGCVASAFLGVWKHNISSHFLSPPFFFASLPWCELRPIKQLVVGIFWANSGWMGTKVCWFMALHCILKGMLWGECKNRRFNMPSRGVRWYCQLLHSSNISSSMAALMFRVAAFVQLMCLLSRLVINHGIIVILPWSWSVSNTFFWGYPPPFFLFLILRFVDSAAGWAWTVEFKIITGSESYAHTGKWNISQIILWHWHQLAQTSLHSCSWVFRSMVFTFRLTDLAPGWC